MQKRIYLDSVTIIYLLENTAKKPAVLSVLSKYPNHTICSSALALMECLVKPLQNNNQLLVAAYDSYFQTLLRIPSHPQVFRRAAEIRALTNLRTPDALHLAYASTGRCELIITGDQKLATVWNQKRPLPFPISAVLV
jgi:predicted nucleic acid-binding protein